ncbi:MAG: 50S ribosomal protein L29 [Bacteroidales bacterium]
MSTTKARDLRELSVDDLHRKEADLNDQIFRLRIQKAMGHLDVPLKVRTTRRELAKVKTVLAEKTRKKTAGAAGTAESES